MTSSRQTDSAGDKRHKKWKAESGVLCKGGCLDPSAEMPGLWAKAEQQPGACLAFCLAPTGEETDYLKGLRWFSEPKVLGDTAA